MSEKKYDSKLDQGSRNHIEGFGKVTGDEKLENQPYQIRMDVMKNNLMNIIQIISNATYEDLNNNTRDGVIIDIDSIKLINNISASQLKNNLENDLEQMHQTSKSIFFSCLKEKTINEKLGAEYD